MTAQYYGVIEIPGWLIDEEVDAVLKEEFGFNGKGEAITEPFDTNFDCELNGVYSYSNALATYGKFDDLETILLNKKIPFDRYTSRDCEDSAERVYFRPELGEGSDFITVYLNGSEEQPYIPVDELRSLLALPCGEAMKYFMELLERYDPQVTPLEQYARSEDSPCRLPEEMRELDEHQALQLLQQSDDSKKQYLRSDAGYHYFSGEVQDISGEAHTHNQMYHFRVERRDTLYPNSYSLCSKAPSSLHWMYSDNLQLEPLTDIAKPLPDSSQRKPLYSITLVIGKEKECYAVAATDFEAACKKAIEIYIRELNASKEEHEQVPEVDLETSYEIACACGEDGNLYMIDLQPLKNRA